MCHTAIANVETDLGEQLSLWAKSGLTDRRLSTRLTGHERDILLFFLSNDCKHCMIHNSKRELRCSNLSGKLAVLLYVCMYVCMYVCIRYNVNRHCTQLQT